MTGKGKRSLSTIFQTPMCQKCRRMRLILKAFLCMKEKKKKADLLSSFKSHLIQITVNWAVTSLRNLANETINFPKILRAVRLKVSLL